MWLFPEGTRNYGQGLKPLKKGAFHLARNAALPVIPVVASNYYPDFSLNRLNSGEVIIKYLPALTKETIAALPVKDVVASVCKSMDAEITVLDNRLNQKGEATLTREKQ